MKMALISKMYWVHPLETMNMLSKTLFWTDGGIRETFRTSLI